MKQVTVDLYPAGKLAEEDLIYVVIGARYRNQWIFVRHRERESWEMPAGHIEEGETPAAAAARELYEESGSRDANLVQLCDYRVTVDGHSESGRLYVAEVTRLGPLPPSEIGEVRLEAGLPLHLTYPEVQTRLFERVVEFYR